VPLVFCHLHLLRVCYIYVFDITVLIMLTIYQSECTRLWNTTLLHLHSAWSAEFTNIRARTKDVVLNHY